MFPNLEKISNDPIFLPYQLINIIDRLLFFSILIERVLYCLAIIFYGECLHSKYRLTLINKASQKTALKRCM
jgi:hypothetical protein